LALLNRVSHSHEDFEDVSGFNAVTEVGEFYFDSHSMFSFSKGTWIKVVSLEMQR
jgi:hypothetical protein